MKCIFRTLSLVLLSTAFCLGSVGTIAKVTAQIKPITVEYEGKKLSFEVDPALETGSVLVPFRSVFEAFGLKVDWEPSKQRVSGSNDIVKIDMHIGQKTVTVNNEKVELYIAPKIINGSTMVPLRFVSESMGKLVDWDPATETVRIKNQLQVQPLVTNYGGDSYYPQNNSNQRGKVNPHIYEKNGYLYLLWAEETKNGHVLFNCSVADLSTDKWLYQDHLLKTVKKETSAFQYLFYEDSFYWRTPEGVARMSFNNTATVSQEVYVARSSVPRTKEIMAIAKYDNGKTGVILGSKDAVYLYSEDMQSGFVKLRDINNVLLESINPRTHFLINTSSKIVHIISNNKVKQLNYDTGDMVYNEKGQDKITVLKGSTFTQPVYYNGYLYYLYQEGSDKRVKIASIDYNLNNPMVGIINYVPKDLSQYRFILNEKELHLWKNAEFNRRPSIDFINIIR